MSNLEQLIIDVKESLERQMVTGFADVTARFDARFDEVNSRFDTQAARLERHAALIQTGSRWTNRMNEWSEKIDRLMETKDREIADLRTRVDRLEEKGNT